MIPARGPQTVLYVNRLNANFLEDFLQSVRAESYHQGLLMLPKPNNATRGVQMGLVVRLVARQCGRTGYQFLSWFMNPGKDLNARSWNPGYWHLG